MRTAKDIMHSDLVTIGPELTIGESMQLLLEKQISGLPVIDGAGDLIGVITEFALMAFAYDQGIQHESVAQHMTAQVLTVGPDTPIREIADKFIVHRIRFVPVVDNGRLLGQISRRDVLQAVHDEHIEQTTVVG